MSTNIFNQKKIFFFFVVSPFYVQRAITFERSYTMWRKLCKQSEEVLNLPLIFSSNSGFYYFLTHRQVWFSYERFSNEHKSRAEWVNGLFLWGIEHLKENDWNSVTSPRNTLSYHLSNYWWAGVSNYVYSTMLVIMEFYIFLLLYFTSVLLLMMQSQSSSIAWTAAFLQLGFIIAEATQNILRCIYLILT